MLVVLCTTSLHLLKHKLVSSIDGFRVMILLSIDHWSRFPGGVGVG